MLSIEDVSMEKKILMVCLGNICRSPMAEGIMRQKASLHQLPWKIDSAGTGGWHSGESPDSRAIAEMKKYGIDISQLRARQITVKDFDIFDHIFVMDSTNYIDVIRICRNDKDKRKVELFLNLLEPGKNKNVSDPYYGGQQGFTDVYEVLNKASDKFIEIHVNGTKG